MLIIPFYKRIHKTNKRGEEKKASERNHWTSCAPEAPALWLRILLTFKCLNKPTVSLLHITLPSRSTMWSRLILRTPTG